MKRRKSKMKKYIFINYFSDKNEDRKKEYLYCVQKNVEPDFIDKVFIFVEDPEAKKDIPINDKIVFIDIPKRMEFNDVVHYAAKNLEDDSIIIILNLDIFIENSTEWANIDKDFFEVGYPNKALVCKRHNLDENMNTWIEGYSWQKGEFCDAWIMKTPLNPDFLQEDFNFCVGGAPQCDNTMMYLMAKYNHVFSWGMKYKIFHLDNCRKNSESKMLLSATTDFRAAARKNHHINIPAKQDWELLLKTETQPKYLPTWSIKNMSLQTIKKPLNKSFSYLAPSIEPDMIRIGHPLHDGGYVIPKISMDKAKGLLSLGINFDWSFDEHWHEINPLHPIHGYDGTIHVGMMPKDVRENYLNFYKDKVVHYKEMAGGVTQGNIVSLDTMLNRIGCEPVFLKMDIEGAEFQMIDHMIEFIDKITGIAIEFHHLCHKRQDFENAVKKLQSVYEIVHVHGNNGGTLKCCSDNIPDVIELTFLSKKLCKYLGRRKNFYLAELDKSNTQGAYDYELYLED